MASPLVCIARIGAAHGVRGEVRLWPFTEDPLAVTQYGPLASADGSREFVILRARPAKDHLVAAIRGISDRNAAEALNGLELFVAREKLPPPQDGEYYHADLIGLRAQAPDGTLIGRVIALHNFGAGDIIEIAPPKGTSLLLPFSDAVVPEVDIAGSCITVVLPQEIEGDEPGSAV